MHESHNFRCYVDNYLELIKYLDIDQADLSSELTSTRLSQLDTVRNSLSALHSSLASISSQLAEIVPHIKRAGDVKKGGDRSSSRKRRNRRNKFKLKPDMQGYDNRLKTAQTYQKGECLSARVAQPAESFNHYESGSENSSSSDSEDEVQCLMADDTEEVFDFSNPEFTREDLVTALNEMVLEYKKICQSFTEFKVEEESCATSAELASSGAMQAALKTARSY
ncbi:hypothetical protein F511_29239 [Dorcoceras hygrometricum]|uniref:Uncharacterized protein n=1 Tax=Dorcoceras hygrometricum TaxID=472368 RepID=A0A2Z7B318_9LAMI|nr:hypothetical protein F511_29239 [Dorcoceras hygrometricum]